jgi:hypothetical protein
MRNKLTPQKLQIVANDEDLKLTKISDDNEPDELALIPSSKKTKGAEYLKDGWILEDNEYICVKCDKVFKKRKPTKNDICKNCK